MQLRIALSSEIRWTAEPKDETLSCRNHGKEATVADNRYLQEEALRLHQAARRENNPSRRRMLESHAIFYTVIAANGPKQKIAGKELKR